MYKFKNIDDYIPERFEQMGMLKGKRWYSKKPLLGLFKPQRYEFGDRKVFCANHYGEFLGYLLADGAGVNVCPAELAHLSEYYPNIHKERNHGTPIAKDGCITYSVLKYNERLEHGGQVIERFSDDFSEEYSRITSQNRGPNSYDDIEIILSSIEARVKNFYKDTGKPETEIESLAQQEKNKMISYIVYDCLYGNNDRHDENWAMKLDVEGNAISLYPLYDNERVLGLYENQRTIEEALKSDNVEMVSERLLFSRMRIPGERKKYSSYKDVLNYMMANYTKETESAIKLNLEKNTPERVSEYLDSCEGLPECYKKFAKKVYLSRSEFAKNLIKAREQTNLDNEVR